jgi:hypothetical protein
MLKSGIKIAYGDILFDYYSTHSQVHFKPIHTSLSGLVDLLANFKSPKIGILVYFQVIKSGIYMSVS